MTDNPTPVGDPHIDFARAVVALAKEHGVGSLTISFRRSSFGYFYRNGGKGDWTQVTAAWAEGRHGAESKINLRAEAALGVSEIAPPDAPLNPLARGEA